jgi:hypothetical protein
MGIIRNLILRVLCLNRSMPASAPNGPKKPSAKSRFSGVLGPLLLLLNLSIPNVIKQIKFMASKRISAIV